MLEAHRPDTVLSRANIPENAHQELIVVRSYEVGRDGHVHPATVLRYCEFVATRASAAVGCDHWWYAARNTAWVVRELRLRLFHPLALDEPLLLATWLSEHKRVQALRQYAIVNRATGVLAARGQARWAYTDTISGRPLRITDDLLERFAILGAAMPPHTYSHLPHHSASPRASMRFTARGYEIDVQQRLNNSVYVDWLEEALDAAEPRRSHDLAPTTVLEPRYLHIEYLRGMAVGETLCIHTRTGTLKAHGLVAEQDAYCEPGDTPALRAYSEYATP